tara:strand:+ start:879 stop:1145 length:267 start_codon:yes stop_codon:yes gene_type:complete
MIDEIKKRISLKIDINQIEIIDQSHQHAGHSQNKGGGHYKAIIISNDFVNKSLVERHQMVYEALGNLMQNEIHAFSMSTLTVSEFNKQ